MKPVHPRVCGEQRAPRLHDQALVGSSPRVRGTAVLPGSLPPALRFIPACAGNSWRRPPPTCPSPVHPRVCGEQRLRHPARISNCGSSPRVRGTATPPSRNPCCRRFIPACAGNSSGLPLLGGTVTVHPRVCGEQIVGKQKAGCTVGSSPRVRGTVLEKLVLVLGERFIPACAGNRASALRAWASAAVHPRVCGEQSSTARTLRFTAGSSPRVRGTGLRNAQEPRDLRFIPACAGNRRYAVRRPKLKAVHPRVCGEQDPGQFPAAMFDGSSPRVRGTDQRGLLVQQRPRFIPACAGNRFTSRSATKPQAGSSPRVRGTVHARAGIPGSVRFIPACAGNSTLGKSNQSPTTVHPRVCGEQLGAFRKRQTVAGSSPRVRGTGLDGLLAEAA